MLLFVPSTHKKPWTPACKSTSKIVFSETTTKKFPGQELLLGLCWLHMCPYASYSYDRTQTHHEDTPDIMTAAFSRQEPNGWEHHPIYALKHIQLWSNLIFHSLFNGNVLHFCWSPQPYISSYKSMQYDKRIYKLNGKPDNYWFQKSISLSVSVSVFTRKEYMNL